MLPEKEDHHEWHRLVRIKGKTAIISAVVGVAVVCVFTVGVLGLAQVEHRCRPTTTPRAGQAHRLRRLAGVAFACCVRSPSATGLYLLIPQFHH